MTPEEKQEIINAVISQLLSDGCDITGLDAAQSLDGISTFPAVLTTTNNGVTTKALVSVPISLLTQAVQDVITSANTAATSARSAAAGWAAAAVKMGSDIVVIEGDITNLQDADKSISTLTAYAECSTAANVSAKAVTVQHFALPTSGGCLHIKMEHANTAVSGVTLNINATGAKDLLYNGSAVSATNTWQDGEVLEIYYDGTNYQATNVQGGGSAEPSYVVPTWSGYVGASNATTIENVNLNNLTSYSNKSGSVSITISSTSYLWFAVNREVRIESFGIEVPVQYMGMDNDLYYYKTYEEILPSTIGVELIATDASQGDDSGGGDTPTPTPTAQKPTIVTPPQSANYNEGATPNALTVVASVSDGGTLSFQWYKDNSPFGSADSGTTVSNGVQSSCTPTSDVTASYYCIITNSKSGENSNTNQTTPVTVTFNEESSSEETDLTGFTEGKLDANGNVVSDSNYVISPKYAVSDIANNQITIYDGFDNRSSGDPALFLSLWAGTDESPEYKGKWSKNRNAANFKFTAVTGYNGAKGVFAKSEIDYCFLKIGNTYPFKGCKVENDFLSKILDFGVKYNAGVLESNNGYDALATSSNTFVVGPFNLEEGTYQIGSNISENMDPSIDRVTFFNNGDYVNRYFAKLSSFTYSNGKITRPGGTTAETIPSGSVFYILCAMSLMHECYLMRDGVYLWKGAKIV